MRCNALSPPPMTRTHCALKAGHRPADPSKPIRHVGPGIHGTIRWEEQLQELPDDEEDDDGEAVLRRGQGLDLAR
jgi:hypothetical protein